MKHLLLLLLAFVALASAWTKEDHQIFRLKDELEQAEGEGTTFYEHLGVAPSATTEDIGRALRKLAKSMHPDKAKAAYLAERATSAGAKARSSYRSATSSAKAAGKPTSNIKPPKPTASSSKKPTARELKAATKRATERFARMGAIGDVLRGPERERYDHFLRHGFPAWRGTGWYYQRYRPGLGSVLAGLFVFAGGAVHYAVLTMSYRRRRAFVARYIAHARTMAWGDSSSVAGIPGISSAGETAAAAPADPDPAAAADDPAAVQAMNRRERRAQEKAAKKPSAKARKAAAAGAGSSGTATPQNEPASGADPAVAPGSPAPAPGPRRRVLAENGKVLVVDSVGSVFLEEAAKDEDADSDDEAEGPPQLFLLNPDEEQPPRLADTMVWRLPVWAVRSVSRLVRAGAGGGAAAADADQADPADAATRRRRKIPLKPKPGQFGAAVAEAPAVSAGDVLAAGEEELDGFVAVAGEEEAASEWVQNDPSAAAARKRKGKIRK